MLWHGLIHYITILMGEYHWLPLDIQNAGYHMQSPLWQRVGFSLIISAYLKGSDRVSILWVPSIKECDQMGPRRVSFLCYCTSLLEQNS